MIVIKKRTYIPVVFILIVLMAVVAPVLANAPVKNVIMMIGDGMGVSHITAARISLKDGAYSKLNLDSMPYTGLSVNFSTSHLVTDSAASGTALATGFRTDNGSLSDIARWHPCKKHSFGSTRWGIKYRSCGYC